MVSAGTKRKRRERENRVAAAVEEARTRAAVDRRVLGREVNAEAPDVALFVVDRKGKSKERIQQELYEQAAEQRRAAKRARRATPKGRKSESAIARAENANEVPAVSLGKKKKGVATVEREILSKRKFDKPRGHVGNVSEEIRKSKLHEDGKEDVWIGGISKAVASEIGLNRRRLTSKMNAVHRKATSVVHPADGLSINPAHADHQDKLGEALAKVVDQDDYKQWVNDKMKFDPALLEESAEGEFGDTGMKIDELSNVSDEEDDDEPTFAKPVTGERKTRAQRNKEARKRIMAANISKKNAMARLESDLQNIEHVAEEAKQLAAKVSGEEKLRRLEENPPLEKPVDAPVLAKLSGQKVRNETASEPVPLSTELSESMRGVTMPVANPLVRDRFLSFERRGIIEPPKVLPKEMWRMRQAEQQELMRDKLKRKGRGSRSNMTFWRQYKKK